MDNDDIQAIEMLGKSGSHDTMLVRTYSVHRITKSGVDQMVTVKVFDRGPNCTQFSRFMCSAKRDHDGKGTSGNEADTIEAALFNLAIHWSDLD